MELSTAILKWEVCAAKLFKMWFLPVLVIIFKGSFWAAAKLLKTWFLPVLVTSSRAVSERLVVNLGKQREVFGKHGPKNKNLSLFLHICYGLWDTSGYCGPTKLLKGATKLAGATKLLKNVALSFFVFFRWRIPDPIKWKVEGGSDMSHLIFKFVCKAEILMVKQIWHLWITSFYFPVFCYFETDSHKCWTTVGC